MVNSISILNIIKIILNKKKNKSKLELIINISSDAGSINQNKDGDAYIYRTSKSALNSITKNLSIDLNKSILIGDRLSDMNAGVRSRLKTLVHVLSSHGINERNIVKRQIDSSGKFLEGTKSSEIIFLESLNDFPTHLLQRSL